MNTPRIYLIKKPKRQRDEDNNGTLHTLSFLPEAYFYLCGDLEQTLFIS